MIIRYKVIITSILASAVAILSGCQEEKFRTNDVSGSDIRLSVDVKSTWQGGVAEASQRAASQCAVITKIDSDTPQPLYLHTTSEPDSVYACTLPPSSRGTMISDKENFHRHFSLSGICYTGSYPSEPENTWTPEFAHNLKYNNDGTPTDASALLQWPGSGAQVKFFAFAPYPDENNTNITLSGPDAPGSPRITYTVPENATEHTDLMVAVADVSSTTDHTDVELKFGHALTAVKVIASESMLECKVERVTFSGIYTTGTYNMGSATWEGTAPTGECYAALNQQTPSETSKIVDGEYTFLMLPQTLPDGATLTIKYTETLTGAARTLTAPINGKTWEAGKIVTYKISTESVSVVAGIEILTPIPAETEDDLSTPQEKELSKYYGDGKNKIPYTGVLYDLTFKPYIETSEADNSNTAKKYLDNPDAFTIEATYTVGEESRSASIDVTKNAEGDGFKGVLDMSALSPNRVINPLTKFNSTQSGTKETPTNLGETETANCYMIDAPGYYSFPLVYGNALNNSSAYTIQHPKSESTQEETGNTIKIKGMTHYVDHNNNMIDDSNISGATEAILVWQDSPDLVRDVKLNGTTSVSFHVDKRTIAQGNAMIAVRDASKTILWSWHIWVTTASNKSAWDNPTHVLKPKDSNNTEYQYKMAPTNLGYCEDHEACPAQTITLNLTCKVRPLKTQAPNKQGKNERAIESSTSTFTFSQEGIEKSMAGDNPYYQWGRKDPMPPGVYTSKEDKNYGNSSNANNITNKKRYNVYTGYEQTRTPIDDVKNPDKQGVSIGYTIQHPNQHIMGKDNELNPITTLNGNIDYRKHWHRSRGEGYLPTNTNETIYVMYNLWNSSAKQPGKSNSDDPINFQKVTKTIYDPCPPGYHVPPAGAFLALAGKTSTTSSYVPITGNEPKMSADKTYWTVNATEGGELKFYAVGLRDLNHKDESRNEDLPEDQKVNLETMFPNRKTDSWCSFNQLTFITTATLVYTSHGYQELIFFADHRKGVGSSSFRYGACTDSNDAYGMPVRPVQTITSPSNETSR